MTSPQIDLIDATSSLRTREFFLNAWPMYVHELCGLGATFYKLDATGRWQPPVAPDWLANVTPNVNLRSPRSALDPQQPFQRTHVITNAGAPVGFVCVGSQPFKYMPEDVDRCIAEFFLVHGQRGRGVSTLALTGLLQAYPPGRWHLRVLAGNVRAQRFWSRALVVAGARELEQRHEDTDVTWRFLTSAQAEPGAPAAAAPQH
jgi:predicted acetyltransferase